MDNKCRYVDVRAFREAEVADGYATNPTHEQRASGFRWETLVLSEVEHPQLWVKRPTPKNTLIAPRWTLGICFGRILVVISFIIIVAPFRYIAVHVVQLNDYSWYQPFIETSYFEIAIFVSAKSVINTRILSQVWHWPVLFAAINQGLLKIHLAHRHQTL